MSKKTSSTIEVSIEKSHIITLGEKMYIESIELIRELVNNAYDADATDVYVTVKSNSIKIEDNGSGMNEKGLSQFFTVGSEEKKIHSISSRFGRKRIGQFGIGKFAVLTAADQFVVESKKKHWKYHVVFDRYDWEKGKTWELPIIKEKATSLDKEGTKVILTKLKKSFSPQTVERYLRESIPLKAKKFNVFLNGKKIMPRLIAGRTIPIKLKTIYGIIEGDIVVAFNLGQIEKPGLECRVKQVLVKRDFFGLEKKYKKEFSRTTGSVNADFLPIISARTDFIKDSPEYKLFYQLIKAELAKILKEIKQQSEKKYLKKVSQELRQVLDRIRQSLVLNPDLIPSGRSIARRQESKEKSLIKSAIIPSKGDLAEKKNKDELKKETLTPKSKASRPKPSIIKKIRLKKLGISCGIVSLGEDGPEVISESNIVYINQDHPLYKKFYPKREILDLYLLRLITQEIVLMRKLRLSAFEAFKWQGKLIKDALCERKQKEKITK